MPPRGIRPPAVAGTFYPQDPQQLRSMIQRFLAKAPKDPQGEPKALIAPHAGYVYSGQVAAFGYHTLNPAPAHAPRRIFVLSPCHRVYQEGISVGNYRAYRTPLGDVEIDQEVVALLASQPDVSRSPEAHERDHALEVQLPFLQETVVHFRLVPIMFGDISGGHLADLVGAVWQPDDLIVVSSDLSHFHPYEKAVALDRKSHEAVLSRQPRPIESCEACGRTGMSALLELARRQQWVPKLANYCNSGDTAGDKGRVVGYATYLFYPESNGSRASATHDSVVNIVHDSSPLSSTATHLPDLPKLVRRHLTQTLQGKQGEDSATLIQQFPALAKQGATFITLTKRGQLRGCIGSLAAHRNLAEDLLQNGQSAATRDPRFSPVTAEELETLQVEVSLLSAPEPLLYRDGEDLLTLLQPGVHGVILQKEGKQATFLPQVWEQLPDPVTFLSHLCQKAGLGEHCWQDHPQISLYTVDKMKESDR